MKTTIEIRDDLLQTAKDVARKERRTLRSVLEEGLHLALERRRQPTDWSLPDESFGGNGLCEEAADAGWAEIRAMSYGPRGG